MDEFHFDIGNSADGPIGMCAVIQAKDQSEALAVLREELPDEVEVKASDGRVVYITIYLNGDNIKLEDIDS